MVNHEEKYIKVIKKLKSHPLNYWLKSKKWRWFPHQLETVYYETMHSNLLIVSPTGTGKTLSSFLPSFLNFESKKFHKKIYTIYISPLKALANDIERNINLPIKFLKMPITVETRTGDTSQTIKNRQIINSPNFLMTTPESLALLNARKDSYKLFDNLKYIIIDELHLFLNTKRGDLLNLNISRLRSFSTDVKTIGITATPGSLDYAKKWISEKDTKIIKVKNNVDPDIEILSSKNKIPWSGHSINYAINDIYEILTKNNKTIIFVNTRAQVERVFNELWKVNEKNLKISLHHGSLEKKIRKNIEDSMSLGNLDCLVATSSLDLGIDWADINLVINIGAPKSINRLFQRIGRSNHKLNVPSKAILVPTNSFEYIECYAAKKEILKNNSDEIIKKNGSLDVLAQHICGVACASTFIPDFLYKEIISSFPYKDLEKKVFFKVLNFVKNGGYSLKSYEDYNRIKTLSNNMMTIKSIKFERKYKMNIGTIIESPMLKLKLKNKVLGFIEENFILNLSIGDTFLFGGETFEFENIKGLNVFVKKSRNKNARIPSYFGGNISLTSNLSFSVIKLIENKKGWNFFPEQIKAWLISQEKKSLIPSNDITLIEIFPYNGFFYTVIHSFNGRNSNQTLGFLCLRRLKENGDKPIGFTMNEYGLALWSLNKPINIKELFNKSILLKEFEKWIYDTPLVKRVFRDVALISGLVEKKIPGKEKSGKQVLFSTDIIFDVLRKYEPEHILLKVVKEDIMHGMIDGYKLKKLLTKINKKIVINHLDSISPLALPLVLESGRQIINKKEKNEYFLEVFKKNVLKNAEIFTDD